MLSRDPYCRWDNATCSPYTRWRQQAPTCTHTHTQSLAMSCCKIKAIFVKYRKRKFNCGLRVVFRWSLWGAYAGFLVKFSSHEIYEFCLIFFVCPLSFFLWLFVKNIPSSPPSRDDVLFSLEVNSHDLHTSRSAIREYKRCAFMTLLWSASTWWKIKRASKPVSHIWEVFFFKGGVGMTSFFSCNNLVLRNSAKRSCWLNTCKYGTWSGVSSSGCCLSTCLRGLGWVAVRKLL